MSPAMGALATGILRVRFVSVSLRSRSSHILAKMGTDRAFDNQFRRFRRTQSPADLAPIFHGLSPRLMRSARRAGLDEQGAEDVVQETFLAFLEHEERFDADRPLVPWIQGIALRQIRAEKRRRARTAAAMQAAGKSPGTDVEADRPMAALELRRSVQGALSSLSEANRVVVSAAVLDGMGIDEMASKFGISRSAVSVRLHRGLARVRERLGERATLGILAIAIPRSGEAVPAAMTKGSALGAAGSFGSVALVVAGVLSLVAAGWWGLRDDGAAQEEMVPVRATLAAETADPVLSLEAEVPERGEGEGAAAAAAVQVLEGEVQLANGLPAPAGAQVFALRTDPELALPTEPLVSLAETSEDGTFKIPVSKLPAGDPTPLLMVRAGADVGWIDADVASGDVQVIALEPEFRMRVRVTDEGGAPVMGARLAAFSQVPRFMAAMGPVADEFGFIPLEPYRHLFGATTDDQGIGIVRGLFGANVPDMMCGLSVKAPGYARMLGAYLSDGGTEMEIEVTLREPESMVLEGVALDADGAPVEGVSLRFDVRGEAPREDTVIAASGPDGRWAVPSRWLDEFPLFLTLDHPAYATESVFVEQATHLDGTPWTVELIARTALQGTVVDGGGDPVAGATVRVVGARTFSRTTTDATGTFRLNDLVAGSPHVVLATDPPQDGPREAPVRSAMKAVAQGEEHVTIVLPGTPAVDVLDVVMGAAGEGGWARCELVPAGGTGLAVDLMPASIDGRCAHFRHVPEGRWFVCGQLSSGAVVVERVDVTQGSGRFVVEPVETATVDCVTGGTEGGECLIVARQADVPELPGWLYDGGVLPRTDLYGIVPAGESFSLCGLVPGRWQVYATGDGWAAQPMEVILGPGESARVDLTADSAKAGRASFSLPAVSRSCLLRIEVRRSELDPWHLVGIPSVAMGVEESFEVVLAPGRWHWRAWLDTNAAEFGALGLGPPTHGVVDVEAGGRAPVDVLAGALAQ